MKNLFVLASLSLAALSMSTTRASAWLFCNPCCCQKCCATICCRPYNAFSPCVPVTIKSNGCCPVLNCCGAAGCYGGACYAGASYGGDCCGADGSVGQLPNLDGSGTPVFNGPMPSTTDKGAPTTMAPAMPMMPGYTVPTWNGGMVPGMNTGYAPMYNQGYMPQQYPGYAPMNMGYGGMNPAAYWQGQQSMGGSIGGSPTVHNAFNPSPR